MLYCAVSFSFMALVILNLCHDFSQLGIKTRLQDFYIFMIMKNCKLFLFFALRAVISPSFCITLSYHQIEPSIPEPVDHFLLWEADARDLQILHPVPLHAVVLPGTMSSHTPTAKILRAPLSSPGPVQCGCRDSGELLAGSDISNFSRDQ